jgi:hypothetical protein
MTVEQKTTVQFDILLAINGEDSYGRGGVFHPLASVGSSHNRLTSAEENEEALLLGCPPIGLLDRRILGLQKSKPYIPGLKWRGFTA